MNTNKEKNGRNEKYTNENNINWHNEFTKPYNIFSTLLGIIGIIFGYYTYFISKERPELSIYEIKQIIFDVKDPSFLFLGPSIEIIDHSKENKKIESNIYSSQITIWNSGNVRLDMVNNNSIVRKPFSVSLVGKGTLVGEPNSARILRVFMNNPQDEELDNFKFEVDNDNVKILWKYFDPGKSVALTVVYTGDFTVNLHKSVRIAGMDKIRDLSEEKPFFHNSYFSFTFLFFIYSIAFLFFLISLRHFDKYVHNKKFRFVFLFSFPLTIYFSFLLISAYILNLSDPYNSVPRVNVRAITLDIE